MDRRQSTALLDEVRAARAYYEEWVDYNEERGIRAADRMAAAFDLLDRALSNGAPLPYAWCGKPEPPRVERAWTSTS